MLCFLSFIQTKGKIFLRMAFILALCCAWSSAFGAEDHDIPTVRNWIEVTGKYHFVTNGYGDWSGAELRAGIPVGKNDVFYLDTLAQRTFHDDGTYTSIANTHTWNEDWYSHIAVGAGTGDFYFPTFRTDATLSRKWLDSKRLITTVGGGYSNAMDNHSDWSLLASLAVYPIDTLIVEGGARFNWSNPGSVSTQRGFMVTTYGADRQRYVTLRIEGGREGYQVTGPAQTIVDFSSYETSLAWREWLGKQWGAVVKAEYYDNPFYSRTGITAGLFYEW